MSKTAYIRFERQLSKNEFDNLVEAMLAENNHFHLWGNPFRLGPCKIHVYGVDIDAWIPVSIEVVSDKTIMIVEGNNEPKTEQEVIDRFVTNLRRHLGQKISTETDE